MAKKVLSIVIGSEYTKVCEVSYKKNYRNKGIRVFRSISFPTPENSIEDGYIKDMDIFGEELKNQLKAAKLKADKVIFSIASSKIANREIILPPTKEKKIMDIIQTGASEYFPIDIKDYILSYQVLEKITSARKKMSEQKKLSKKETKLAKQQEKLSKKALKKKSKTELIADRMEQMEAKTSEQNQNAPANENSVEKTNKKHMRLSVYAVPSTLIKNYYNFAKAMHMDIVSMDYSGNSSYQIIKRQVNHGTNVFVQLNEQDTLISILRDDVLILQRIVGYGISMLLDAVIEQDFYQIKDKDKALELLENKNLLTLGTGMKDQVKFDSSWTKGEAAAASEVIKAANITGSNEELQEKEAKRNIIDSLHFLTNSIARMLDYYKSNNKHVDINAIYLSGTGVRIQGIDQFFYSEIGMTNKKMEKLWTVSANKKAASYRKNPSEFISCIGAVIKPIDFVPKEFIEKKQKRSAIFATIIFTLACIAGSAGTIYVSYTDYLAAKQKLDQVNEQLAALPQDGSVKQAYDEAAKELDSLQQFVAATDSKNNVIKAIIEELEKKLPSGTRINNMQFSADGVSMNVTAGGDMNALIAKMYEQLEAIEYFSKVDISNVAEQEDGVESKVSFTITCTYAQ
jgi:type IV pilus assembly protein PilM